MVLKGYPRLSETFIAQELLGLERCGLELALRVDAPSDRSQAPSDPRRDPGAGAVSAGISASGAAPGLARLAAGRRLPRYRAALGAFLADLRRDPTRNRIRRFGQALVLVAEWPEVGDC